MTPLSEPMNILVTLDEAYLPHLNVMLYSLLAQHPAQRFCVYLLHSAIRDEALEPTRRLLAKQGELHAIPVDGESLTDAPTTDRYPREMYYRIFAAQYLPDTLERVLYLDPDLIVNGDLAPLYQKPLGDCLFAAASHVGALLEAINERRLDCEDDSLYINSGVLLMNLPLLRREQEPAAVFDYIERHRHKLVLPDQDVISGLYGHRVLPLDPYVYNMTERLLTKEMLAGKLTPDWVRGHSRIIHYCGRNKPWKPHYVGLLGGFYTEAAAAWRETCSAQIEKDCSALQQNSPFPF